MSKAVITAALATLIVPQVAPTMRGYASRYDSGVMEGVVNYRYETGYWRTPPPENVSDIAAYIAVQDCNAVGRVAEVRPVGGPWVMALVADCAQRDDPITQGFFTDNGIIMELDYETFTAWAAEYGLPLVVEMRPAVQVAGPVYSYE